MKNALKSLWDALLLRTGALYTVTGNKGGVNVITTDYADALDWCYYGYPGEVVSIHEIKAWGRKKHYATYVLGNVVPVRPGTRRARHTRLARVL